MKSKYLPYWILGGLVLILGITLITTYNSLVNHELKVEQTWAEVQNQYQRRADLIPNLVSTVKGYAAHESKTFEDVTKARAAATSITIDPANMTQEQIDQFQKVQNDLTGALKSLLAVSEAYPDLKASENFKDLQVQLEGTENRVTTARQNYTKAVQEFNSSVRSFPSNLSAGIFGFSAKPQFAAEQQAQTAPKVEF